MAKASAQKFIARNRAPRVQIEYDVELYGAEKKVQLPFVVGVQWHPEYWVRTDAASASLFRAFGEAVRTYRESKLK